MDENKDLHLWEKNKQKTRPVHQVNKTMTLSLTFSRWGGYRESRHVEERSCVAMARFHLCEATGGQRANQEDKVPQGLDWFLSTILLESGDK